jgi:hypothetical protein
MQSLCKCLSNERKLFSKTTNVVVTKVPSIWKDFVNPSQMKENYFKPFISFSRLLNLGSKTLGIIENNGAIKGTIDTKNILRKKYTIFDQYIPLHIIS